MKTERINGHPIKCYDSPKFGDRYTVVFLDQPERGGMFVCLGMSERPFHPQGIGQHSAAQLGRHLGKRVAFTDLPNDCQKAVLQEWSA